MRKIFLFMMVSLDGYFEGLNHDISWHNVDQEFNEFAARQLDEADTLIFGHKTYDLMASFWPTSEAKEDDPVVAEKMNTMSKIVVSSKLNEALWTNTRLIKNNVDKELVNLKKQDGKSLVVLGSSNLSVSLIEMGLLDELRIMVNPVVLGSGSQLLGGLKNKLDLKLSGSRVFDSGNVLLTYEIHR